MVCLAVRSVDSETNMRDDGNRQSAAVWYVVAAFTALLVLAGMKYDDERASAATAHAQPEPKEAPVARVVVPMDLHSVVHEAEPPDVDAYEMPTALYSDDVEAHARLVANEEGLAHSSRPGIGTYLIGSVLRRNAGIRHVSITEVVAMLHPRHTRPGRKTGAWIPGLSKSLERPEGWDEVAIPWYTSTRGQAGWKTRLDEAREFESGEVELVCPAAYPIYWGGPYTDAQRLYDQLESGRVVIVAGPPIPQVPRMTMTADGPVPMRDDAGNVIMRVEQPGWRVEPCYVDLENGERMSASRNVFLARRSDVR
jgi:hypothetical protein